MKFINETNHTIVVPVDKEALAPNHIKVKPGETKEFPENAAENASLSGLRLVSEEEVKSTTSSIADTKVETKQVAEPETPEPESTEDEEKDESVESDSEE